MKEILNMFFIFFCVATLTAQKFDTQKMDNLFAAIEENKKGMGSFSVFQNGEEVYQNSIGYADLQQKIKAGADTKYRIGSISKTFTASMIMQLVEEGKLQLNTKLSKFYPEMPNAESIDIEDLLRHQSGLFNFTSELGYPAYMEEAKTKQEMLEIFKSLKPVFEPGAKNEYSNTNYVLLSFIAEDVTGKSFSKLLQDRIVKPLGLKKTYYGSKINTADFEAQSYKKEKDWVLNTETDLSIPKGAGGVVSTPKELNQFFTALFSGKVVKPESLEKMKDLKNGYGMGLFSYPLNDKVLYGHTGGIDGFGSMAIYDPETELAAAYISNAIAMPVGDIMAGALSISFGMDYDIPELKSLELSAEELQKFTGNYTSQSFPLDIRIFEKNGILMVQATGQSSFPLEAYEPNKFEFARAGLKLEFTAEEGKMLMMQNGVSYQFNLE
ncbi:MAG: serine hydrolase domain-containing protein [Salinimicrobium sp.]